jgi:hypothetical protein
MTVDDLCQVLDMKRYKTQGGVLSPRVGGLSRKPLLEAVSSEEARYRIQGGGSISVLHVGLWVDTNLHPSLWGVPEEPLAIYLPCVE